MRLSPAWSHAATLAAVTLARCSQSQAADGDITMAQWHVATIALLLVMAAILALQNWRLARTVRERDASQKALITSESRFRAFAEASPASITIKDTEGRYIFVNRHLAERWNVEVAGCIGRTARECMPAEFAAAIETQDREVVDSGEVRIFETQMSTPSGDAFHELAIKFPIRGDDGRITGVGVVATDTTPLKKTQEALDRTVRALRTLSAGNEVLVRAGSERELLDAVCRIVVEKGGYPFARVSYVANRAPLKLAPIARFGGSWTNGSHSCSDLYAAELAVCPAYSAAEKGEVIVSHEFPACLHEACGLDCREDQRIASIALPLKHENAVFGVLTILSDQADVFDDEEMGLLAELATDLAFGIVARRAETERRWTEETVKILYQAMDQSSGAVIITDAQGRVRHVNRRLEELTGYGADQALGRSVVEAGTETGSGSVFCHLARLIAAGGELADTHQTIRKDGSSYWAQTSVSPVRDGEGQTTNYVLMHKDISANVETERRLRQAEKMEALGNLAGGIAHDFNNMLLPIRALSKMVLRDLGASPQARRLERVVEAANRAEELVRRILAFSRSGDIAKKDEDLAELVRETVELLRSTLPSSVTLESNVGVPTARAIVDRAQIQTVLLNLGANAAQAMAGRVGRLTVSLAKVAVTAPSEEAQLGPGDYALLAVTDTGNGIDPQVMPRIFEPFFTTKGVGEGTGLGLSMAHGIVTDHGGAISVESSVGVGTTFRIFLPLCVGTVAVDTEAA